MNQSMNRSVSQSMHRKNHKTIIQSIQTTMSKSMITPNNKKKHKQSEARAHFGAQQRKNQLAMCVNERNTTST